MEVLARAENLSGHNRRWTCRCDCGTIRIVTTGNLRNGHTKSCGCLLAEIAPTLHVKHGHARHHRVTSEFSSWAGMLDRCRNANAKPFKYYGGRGIRVCDAWSESFAAFLADMGLRPSRLHSLDRIDNDGHYEPGNVRWAIKETQMTNQRSNRQVAYRGRTQPLVAWTRELGLNYKRVHARLSRGLTVDEAFSDH